MGWGSGDALLAARRSERDDKRRYLGDADCGARFAIGATKCLQAVVYVDRLLGKMMHTIIFATSGGPDFEPIAVIQTIIRIWRDKRPIEIDQNRVVSSSPSCFLISSTVFAQYYPSSSRRCQRRRLALRRSSLNAGAKTPFGLILEVSRTAGSPQRGCSTGTLVKDTCHTAQDLVALFGISLIENESGKGI